ncbi:MAG: hypothetical protein ACJAS4_003603 [Bacteriovoracaceae bacterium]|jgi:hypothetical protein
MEFVFLDPQDILLLDMHFCIFKENKMQTKYNYQRIFLEISLVKSPKFRFKKKVRKRILMIIWEAFRSLFIAPKMVRMIGPDRWEHIPRHELETHRIM